MAFKKLDSKNLSLDPYACWILASPRSGSTYLCHLLNQAIPKYKNISFTEHFGIENNSYYSLIHKDTHDKLKLNYEYLSVEYRDEFRKLLRNVNIDYYFNNQYSFPTRNKFMIHHLTWINNTYKNMVNNYKSIYNKISNKIPNIKYINIVRKNTIAQSVSLYHADFSKVYLSFQFYKSYHEKVIPFNFEEIFKSYSYLKQSQGKWKDFILQIPEEKYITVFYEDLRNNPKNEISRIGKFLNFPINYDFIKNKIIITPTTKKESYDHRKLFEKLLKEKK